MLWTVLTLSGCAANSRAHPHPTHPSLLPLSQVRLLWGVPKALFGVLPGRVTYVIDKTGKCISVTDDIGNAAKHPADALKALSA